MKSSEDYYKELVIGRTRHCRYSRKALERLRTELPGLDADAIWAARRAAHQPGVGLGVLRRERTQ